MSLFNQFGTDTSAGSYASDSGLQGTTLPPSPGQQSSTYTPSQQSGGIDFSSLSSTAAQDYTSTFNTALDLDNLSSTLSSGVDAGSLSDGVYNAVTKGIPLTAASIVNSFVNTGVELGNVFGANSQKLTMQDEFDDPETLSYYQRNSGLIEGAGLFAGSLIPGTLAIKAVRLFRAGEASAALADATGLLRPNVSAKQILSGLAELDAGPAAVYPSLQVQKYTAIASGFADNALEGLAYQTATYATMKASPVTDQESLGDVIQGAAYGSLLNGAIGGILDGIKTNGVFKKALLQNDLDSKAFELTQKVGQLNVNPGDNLVSQQIAKNNINARLAAGAGPAGRLKGNFTTENITLDQRSIAKDMADGDGELGTALVAGIDKASKALGVSSEDIADKFGSLAKISRIDAEPVGIPDSTQFFVNRFSKGATSVDNTADLLTTSEFNPDPTKPNVLSKGVDPNSVWSQKYQLVDPGTPPSIAKYSDQFPSWDQANPGAGPGYKTAAAAWKDGHDLFIDSKGQVLVNPQAPNITAVPLPGLSRTLTQEESASFAATGSLPADASKGAKQLFGSVKTQTPGTDVTGPGSLNPLTEIRPPQTILNTATGDLTNEVTAPTVGDFGRPTISRDGTISYGSQSTELDHSAQTLSNGTPTEANAQYVGWSLRGIRKGDVIQPDNIPALEQLYRQGLQNKGGLAQEAQNLQKIGVRMGDGSSIPTNAQDLLGQIKDAKDTLASQLLLNGGHDLDQVAMRTGTTPDYLTNNMQGKQADWLLDPADSMWITHIKLGYDIGNTNVQQGQVLKGMQDVSYRIQVAQDAATSQLASFVGRSPGNTPYTNFLATKTAADANILGAGSGFLSQANAGYGTLGQDMERIGRATDQLIRRRLDAVNTSLLTSANALRNDPVAAAEAGLFKHVRQSTGQSFSPLPDSIAATEFPGLQPGQKVAVLTDSLSAAKDGTPTWDKTFMPDGFLDGANAGKQESSYNYYTLSPKVAAWEDANAAINDSRIQDRQGWWGAQGYNNSNIQQGTYYAPPINTSNKPFVAYIKPKEGTAFSDNGTAVVVGRTAQELQQKISSLNDGNWSIYFKNQIAADHKIIGDYDYSRNFAQTQVNTVLKNRGILSDLTPTTRADNIIQDALDWHQRAERSLVRDHVELGNAQLFANLDAMGQRFQDSAISKLGPVDRLLTAGSYNPYKEYTNLALAIGNKENYPLWQYAQQKLSAAGSTAFDLVRSASNAALKGIVPYEDAVGLAKQYGIGNLWDSGINAAKNYYGVANKLPPVDVLSKAGGVANAILGNGMIRLDAFQQMIHVLSTPIMMSSEFQSLLKNSSDLVTTAIPGTNGQKLFPSVTKMMYQAVRNLFDPGLRDQYNPLYSRVGVDTTTIMQQRAAEASLGLPMGRTAQSVTDWANNAISKVPVLGNNLPQKFIHWVAADVGRQLFEGAGQQGTELEQNMMTWMNRVQGNYIASQRPVGFQGPLGQAIGLFQTYQFNVAQQLFRYIQDGDTRAIAVGAAVHGSLFGLQGMPGFHLINNSIIGNYAGNSGHDDIYSAANKYLGKDMADWLLYGAISNVTQTGLYTRGDLNPRNLSILPINPLSYPAISGGIKLASNLYDTASKIAGGGPIGVNLLLGLEHNGISRPLSGLAQLAQGFTTDSKGNIVSANTGSNAAGFGDLQSAFNMARLFAGGRNLDDAIAQDAVYRKSVYQANTEAKIQAIGATVKSAMYGNQVPTPDQMTEFASQYRDAGGDVGKFASTVHNWSTEANTATANKIFTANKQNPLLQNIQQGMGGVPLADFRSTLGQFDTQAAGTGTTQ